MGDLVELECPAETLLALSDGLTLFGPVEGEPHWLISGVWLCTRQESYVATSSVEVRPDGHVARPLSIASPDELTEQVRVEIPDVSSRLLGRGSRIKLPDPGKPPSRPLTLKTWRTQNYSTSVLIRVSRHASSTNRVACAILFTDAGHSLLVGTDVSSLALVLSEDVDLIERYRAGCEALTATQYLENLRR